MRDVINWKLLGGAVDFYVGLGYQYIEVPWRVSPVSAGATHEGQMEAVDDGSDTRSVLIGSAEQGFVELNPPMGRYVSCSPCFRVERVDAIHHRDFMKVELFENRDVSDDALSLMITHAQSFLGQNVTRQPTADGIDLMLNGIEIGSYGRRTYRHMTWLYGTGLALPRYDYAKNNK